MGSKAIGSQKSMTTVDMRGHPTVHHIPFILSTHLSAHLKNMEKTGLELRNCTEFLVFGFKKYIYIPTWRIHTYAGFTVWIPEIIIFHMRN
jgi:hypothetical protein